jgi:hypothetical protein
MKLPRLFAIVCLLLGIACAQAANIPAHIRQELPDARLSGQGTFRWFGLKIYDAALWVGESGYQPASTKFILNLSYARELYGERIAQASIDEIRELGIGSSAHQQAWLNKMKALLPDVQEGSQISGVYLPGQAARFYLDGKLLGEIWLDPRTSASSLRKQLLANQP